MAKYSVTPVLPQYCTKPLMSVTSFISNYICLYVFIYIYVVYAQGHENTYTCQIILSNFYQSYYIWIKKKHGTTDAIQLNHWSYISNATVYWFEEIKGMVTFWAMFQYNDHFHSYRESYNKDNMAVRLIFIMGILILLIWHLYIEITLRFLCLFNVEWNCWSWRPFDLNTGYSYIVNSSPPGQNGRHFGRRQFQMQSCERKW